MPISETEAWQREVASCDTNAVQIVTLELIHPAFIEGGQQVPVRLCNDIVDRQFRIESGAPFNAGQDAVFIAAPFEADWPKLASDGAFESRVRFSNVGREVSQYLPAAAAINAEAVVILRIYSSATPTVVARGPYRYILHEVDETAEDITGTIRIADPANAKAFRRLYDQLGFPSLLATS